MQEYKTIAELASELGITESSARRWAKQFSEYLPSHRVGKAIKYEADQARHVLRVAKDMFTAGHLAEEISEILVETLARSVPSELVEDGDTSITAVVTGGGVTSEVIQALLASAMQSAMAPLLDELKEVRQQLTTSEQQQQAVIQQLKSTIDSQAAALAQMEARLQNQVNEVRQEVVATLQVQEERRQAEAERDRPVMQAISERLEKRSLWERLLRRS